MSKTRKPCPFCGSESIDMIQNGPAHHMRCGKCGARTRQHLDRNEAIAVWNQRANVHESAKHESYAERMAKAPVFKEGESIIHVDYYDKPGETKVDKWAEWLCPTCGWFVGEQFVPRRHNQKKCNFCSRCGQEIDWDAVEPEKYELHERERERLNELKLWTAMQEWEAAKK